jgi:hypothetical protein
MIVGLVLLRISDGESVIMRFGLHGAAGAE